MRQEIERMVKELNDVVTLRYTMAVALAGQRAAQSGQGYGAYVSSRVEGGSQSVSARAGDPENDIQSREALVRELEQVQNQIRNEIEQARNQADQLAVQIRSLREQSRGVKSGEGQGGQGANQPIQAIGSQNRGGQGQQPSPNPGSGRSDQPGNPNPNQSQNRPGQSGSDQGSSAGADSTVGGPARDRPRQDR
jgi:hypothetical protein